MSEYTQGYSLKVTPSDRSIDVFHHLTTGGLLGGRSLDGVTWEEVNDPELNKLHMNRAEALKRSMRGL